MLQSVTKFHGEIFTSGPITMKFMKVFSLQSFCYTVVGYSDMDLGLHSHHPIFAPSCVTTNSVPLVRLLLSPTSILIQEAHSSSGRGSPGNFTSLGGPNLTFLRGIYTWKIKFFTASLSTTVNMSTKIIISFTLERDSHWGVHKSVAIHIGTHFCNYECLIFYG